MAKRKRLAPPRSLGVKATSPNCSLGVEHKLVARAPIAQVAGDAAAQSALDALADEMREMRDGGRLVMELPLSTISDDHMARDRMVIGVEDMQNLKASLIARGQQTPIEVVDLGQGGYGLVSGWRRLHAFRALYSETGENQFAEIQALIKPIDSVSDSYVAMVEENEIRANLSFYERAHLACEAVRLGVYPTPARAINTLFANTTPAKRSKIGSFVKLHLALGDTLCFPAAIPERLGLALVSALQGDSGFVARLRDTLRKAPSLDVAEERSRLERALRGLNSPKGTKTEEIVPGVFLEARKGRVVLSGKRVDARLRNDLVAWLSSY